MLKQTGMTVYNLDTPRLAVTYDELSDSQFTRGRELVEELGIEPHHVVLDIGAGTGRLGLQVLKTKLGPSGKLIGIDPLVDRIKVANQKNQFANGHFQVGSAEDLTFQADASVDVAYLSSVFHWVPDKKKSLSEINRVLKPNGRVGITTGAKELSSVSPISLVLKRILSAPKYRGLVNPDDTVVTRQGTTSTDLIKLLTEAGFEIERLLVRKNVTRHRSASVYVDFSESSTFGNYLEHVPEALRAEVRAAHVKALEALDGGDGIEATHYGILVVGSKGQQAGFAGHADGPRGGSAQARQSVS